MKFVQMFRGFEPGQEVGIIQGPFQGFKALVTRLITARERVEILIEWMGRTLRAHACVIDLEPSGRGAGCCQKI
jgi:transcription antitermination factor NusG